MSVISFCFPANFSRPLWVALTPFFVGFGRAIHLAVIANLFALLWCLKFGTTASADFIKKFAFLCDPSCQAYANLFFAISILFTDWTQRRASFSGKRDYRITSFAFNFIRFDAFSICTSGVL